MFGTVPHIGEIYSNSISGIMNLISTHTHTHTLDLYERNNVMVPVFNFFTVKFPKIFGWLARYAGSMESVGTFFAKLVKRTIDDRKQNPGVRLVSGRFIFFLYFKN